MPEKDYAFVIGVSQYTEFKELEGPVLDAADFNKWLLEEELVPEDQIYTLLSPPKDKFEKDSPKPDFMKFYADLSRIINKKKANPDEPVGRRAYFYFAGHGFTPDSQQQGEVALLMANASNQMTGMSIPGLALFNYCERNGLFEEIVLVMDCCRTDMAGASTLHADDFSGRLKKTPKRFVALATQAGQPSREGPIEDKDIRGYFTVALLEGLRGKAAKNDRITSEDLQTYIFNRLPKLMPAGKEQEPVIDAPPNRRIVFKGTEPPAISLTVKTKARQAGHNIVLKDGKLNELDRAVAGADPIEFSVATGMGLYQVVDEKTNKEVNFRLIEGNNNEVKF